MRGIYTYSIDLADSQHYRDPGYKMIWQTLKLGISSSRIRGVEGSSHTLAMYTSSNNFLWKISVLQHGQLTHIRQQHLCQPS